jgi:ketosteroid isomerase-like protein
MLQNIILTTVLVFATATTTALAQNTNSSTARPRTTTPASTNRSTTDSPADTDVQKPASTPPAARPVVAKPRVIATEAPGSQALVAAFNDLVNGIRRADAKSVSNVYWNSPRLILFNNNGSVTKGWEQMNKNRESSYRDVKDVKLDVRDVSITMLGRDGAVVSALWTQSQTYKGEPETATGRMTIVFRRVGKDWKAIHLHTSPDKPEPTRVLPSEAAPASSPSPTP